MAIGVSDVRGIRDAPAATWQGKPYASEPGCPLVALGPGVHVPLPGLDARHVGSYRFKLPLRLQGMERLQFTPLGKASRVSLTADWPHPSFFGRFLPSERTIHDDGFEASWQTSWYATNIHEGFQALVDKKRSMSSAQDFGVLFIQPMDIYQQTERVTKYGVLFVLLTFVAFVLFELLRQLRIHPVQYALVGAAQALFYLLLIAMSEHVSFAIAYLVATTACVGVISFYLSFVLQHWRRGCSFGLALVVLYGSLFGIVRSEDNALMLGSALVFIALSGVMVLTRRLDWYAVRA